MRPQDNSVFKTAEGKAKLRRLLVVYSWRNRVVGYAQSMNFELYYTYALSSIVRENSRERLEEIFDYAPGERLELLVPSEFVRLCTSVIALWRDTLLCGEDASKLLSPVHLRRHAHVAGAEPVWRDGGWRA